MKSFDNVSRPSARSTEARSRNEIDSNLIMRIATKRDAEAFTELFLTYSNSAFNLAFYLTRNRSQAEEAVQDAMLDIWKSASNFKPGSAKSWILKIVARRSLKKFNRNARIKTKEMQPDDLVPVEGRAFDGKLEDRELMVALHVELKALGPEDRQMIGLFFSGAYSQVEIAAAIKIPQSTVSFRIRKIVERLKVNLKESGFASAGIAGVWHAQIGTAVLHSQNVSSAWCRGMLTNFRPSVSGSNLEGVKVVSSSVWSLYAGVIAAGFLAAVGFSLALSPNNSGAEEFTNGKQVKNTQINTLNPSISTIDALPSKLKSFDLRWTFEHGLPEELKNFSPKERLFVTPAKSKSPALLTPKDNNIFLLLPEQVKSQPYILSLNVRAVSHGEWGADILYLGKKGYARTQKYWSRFIRGTYKKRQIGNVRSLKIYFTGTYQIREMDGQVFAVEKIAPVSQDARFVLISKNWSYESIEIRSVNVKDIPFNIDDSEAFVKALNLKESIPTSPLDTNRNKIQWREFE